MKEAIIALSDLVLLKMPTETPLSISGFISGNILIGQADIHSPEIYSQMVSISQSRSSVIREFMLSEKYIETTNYIMPHDKMTDKGKQARKLGGHNQYIEWAENQEKESKKELKKINFAQKNWLPIAIGTLILGWGGDLGKQLYLLKFQQPQIIEKTIKDTVVQVLHDTVRIYDTFKAPTIFKKGTNEK